MRLTVGILFGISRHGSILNQSLSPQNVKDSTKFHFMQLTSSNNLNIHNQVLIIIIVDSESTTFAPI